MENLIAFNVPLNKVTQLIVVAFLFFGIHFSLRAQEEVTIYPNYDALLDSLASSAVPALNQTTEYGIADSPLQEMLRGIAALHRLNIEVSPELNKIVTYTFKDVLVKDMLVHLIREHDLNLSVYKNILKFTKKPRTTPRKNIIQYNETERLLTIDATTDSLQTITKEITLLTGRNIILSPGLENKLVSGYIRNANLQQTLESLAFSNNLDLGNTENGFYFFSPSKIKNAKDGNGGDTNSGSSQFSADGSSTEFTILPVPADGDTALLFVNVKDAEIQRIISEATRILHIDFANISNFEGRVTCYFTKISFDDLLLMLLKPRNYSFYKNQNLYLMGPSDTESLFKTELVHFQFRTVDDIDKYVPASLLKGVELKILHELNTVAISGNALRVNDLQQYLAKIDQAIPNVLIEVIVVEVNKGYLLNTGLTALLGKAPPTANTNGSVFPSVNMTITSESINNTLDKYGLTNLGKVSPNFYLNLQAEETSNNLYVRSTTKLSSLNGHEATLTNGQTIYYRQQVQNIAGSIDPVITTTEQFLTVEANTLIKVKPNVSDNDHITLTVSAEFSDFIESTIEGAPPGNATRKFSSIIRVKNEDMIVLGGLEEITKRESRSGLPLLSRIPVLNWIFSKKNREKRDNRLVVFIKPIIVY